MKSKLFAWVSSIAFLVSAISEWGFDIDLPLTPSLWLVMTAVVFLTTNAPAALTTNSWTSSLPGNWHDPFSWSAGVPSNNQALVRIVNSGSKVVLISAATATVPGTMTISNLLLSAAAGATNTLALTDPGTNVPLRVLNTLMINSGGALAISNGAVQVASLLSSVSLTDDGEILLNSPAARLVNTNGNLNVGNSAPGMITVSNGTLLADAVILGNSVGSQGTLTVAGGTNQCSSLTIGDSFTGTVWVTGGQLTVNPDPLTVGDNVGGRLTLSNGNVTANNMLVGNLSGGLGTLTIAGGTNEFTGGVLLVGSSAGATGRVWVTGGYLHVPALISSIGYLGDGQMTVSNGTVLVGGLAVGDGVAGTLTIAGGTNSFPSLLVGAITTATGAVWLTGGQLLTTDTAHFAVIGDFGVGQMTVSNGVYLGAAFQLGTNSTATGTLTVAGGTNALIGPLSVGILGRGAVWVTGGQLVVTNTPATVGAGSGFIVDGSVTLTNGSSIIVSNVSTIIGNVGSGSLTVLGGSMSVSNLTVGAFAGANGTATFAGGTNATRAQLTIGLNANTTGTVWVTGGVFSNSQVNMGGGAAAMTVSNAIWQTPTAFVGIAGQSTLTLAGGTNRVLTTMILGAFDCSSTGNVVVSGGRLFVTNAAVNAALEVRSGTLLQNSGTLVIDKLVITNSCGHFNHTGGTLSITTTNLAAGLDADGDGLPNDWEQSHGLSPLDNTGNNGASGDPDGDGFSNLQEYLGGSNPHSAASVPDAIWNTNSSGKWEVGGNWLIAVPPTNNQSVFITEATPKTVTIDTATPTNNMSIKSLTVGPGNTLQITNTGPAAPLRISNDATITLGGILSVKDAAATMGMLSIEFQGSVLLTNGSLVTHFQDVQGRLSLMDSAVTNQLDMNVAYQIPTPAELWMSGGSLVDDLGDVTIGGGAFLGASSGRMTVSNGSARVHQLNIGYGTGDPASGTLTCAGGTTEATTILWIGTGLGSTGTVWLTGGELVATNATATMIGFGQGRGQMTVSNGTVRLQNLAVGDFFSSGTVTINGGTVYATNVTLGVINCTGTGTVIVAGGSLFVTNAAVAATLNVFSGAVNLNSGTLTVDRLVITNGCGHFVKTGGTLIQNNPPVLGAGLDADGDGLPNDWEQAHGLDPLDPTGNNGATGDPDGDGFTNLQEFQRGTDPQNPSSTPFRITAILQQGNDVLLTWATTGGKTNVVQATVGSSGSYSNNFADISGNIVSNVVGFTGATYLDVGAATNFPARYYRVRLVP